MHETIISQRLLEEAQKQGKLKSITIEVGELAPVPADELGDCLEKLAGCKVVVEEKKASVRCSCGYEGHPKIVSREHDAVVFECPKCKKIPKVVDGEDIVLKEVEV